MKTCSIILISVLLSLNLAAQSISPQVVASSGNYMESGNYSLSCTLGEPIIATAESGTTTLTQGFQQPSYNVTSITQNNLSGFEVNVFPNPTSDYITISWKTETTSGVEIFLYDMSGKLITAKTLSSTDQKASVNLSQLASEQYIMEVKDKNTSNSKIFKIEKK